MWVWQNENVQRDAVVDFRVSTFSTRWLPTLSLRFTFSISVITIVSSTAGNHHWRVVCYSLTTVFVFVIKPYFHYGCALRCVARDTDYRDADFSGHAVPRNVTRSRNGNKPLGVHVALHGSFVGGYELNRSQLTRVTYDA